MLCYVMLCYVMLYYTILYYTILYYTILYYTILYYTILYYTILYYTILYYTILYYTILYYTMKDMMKDVKYAGTSMSECEVLGCEAQGAPSHARSSNLTVEVLLRSYSDPYVVASHLTRGPNGLEISLFSVPGGCSNRLCSRGVDLEVGGFACEMGIPMKFLLNSY